METVTDIFSYLAGLPTIIGLLLSALIVFLTSDWRLSLTALLVEFLLVGVALTGTLRVEIALVKILVGVLVVSILYITARRLQENSIAGAADVQSRRILGMSLGWDSGPLGLPLRLLVVLLVLLVVLRVFDNYNLVLVPMHVAFAAVWLGFMGVAGLILASEPLRVAPALFTILVAFDLVYASLEPSLAVVGFWSALLLLAALAFAYLAVARGVTSGRETRPYPRLMTLLSNSTIDGQEPAPSTDEESKEMDL
jgi:hypothetical protein